MICDQILYIDNVVKNNKTQNVSDRINISVPIGLMLHNVVFEREREREVLTEHIYIKTCFDFTQPHQIEDVSVINEPDSVDVLIPIEYLS